MTTAANPAADVDDLLSVPVPRILPVSPARVFEAWTSPDLLQRWWGPKGFQGISAEADPRPGGAFAIEMRGPDGAHHRMAGVYTELDPPDLICLEIRHRQFEGAADRPEGYIPTQVRIELREHPAGTELILAHTGFPEAALAGRFTEGWTGSFDKLHAILTD